MAYLRIIGTDEADQPYEKTVKLPHRIKTQRSNYDLQVPLVGRGSNGTVFRCETAISRISHAIKFQHFLDSKRRDRFEFERSVLSQLDHPSILKINDEGVFTSQDMEIPFIVTELFRGNLEKEVRPDDITLNCLTPKRAAEIGIQICDGLTYIHSKGVIHRDLKPGNFFMHEDRVVIGDFGLAKTFTDEGDLRFPRDGITLSTEKIGPQDFMSPELLRYARNKQHPVDHRSDIWQLSAVVWFLITGFPPRGKLDAEDDPSGGALSEILDKAMESHPEKRFQTAGEMKNALLEFLNNHP